MHMPFLIGIRNRKTGLFRWRISPSTYLNVIRPITIGCSTSQIQEPQLDHLLRLAHHPQFSRPGTLSAMLVCPETVWQLLVTSTLQCHWRLSEEHQLTSSHSLSMDNHSNSNKMRQEL